MSPLSDDPPDSNPGILGPAHSAGFFITTLFVCWQKRQTEHLWDMQARHDRFFDPRGLVDACINEISRMAPSALFVRHQPHQALLLGLQRRHDNARPRTPYPRSPRTAPPPKSAPSAPRPCTKKAGVSAGLLFISTRLSSSANVDCVNRTIVGIVPPILGYIKDDLTGWRGRRRCPFDFETHRT